MTQQVIKGLYDGATTVEVNTLTAETAATMTTEHSDYALLAGRVSVLSLHKETKNQFSGKKKKTTRNKTFPSVDLKSYHVTLIFFQMQSTICITQRRMVVFRLRFRRKYIKSS